MNCFFLKENKTFAEAFENSKNSRAYSLMDLTNKYTKEGVEEWIEQNLKKI